SRPTAWWGAPRVPLRLPDRWMSPAGSRGPGPRGEVVRPLPRVRQRAAGSAAPRREKSPGERRCPAAPRPGPRSGGAMAGHHPLHDHYGPEARYAVAREAELPTTKWDEEVARGLE